MLTKGDIADALWARLFGASAAASAVPPAAAPARKPAPVKRVFLSDYEVKKLLPPGGRTLKVPANAIISPLSMDWIEFNGIRIVRE